MPRDRRNDAIHADICHDAPTVAVETLQQNPFFASFYSADPSHPLNPFAESRQTRTPHGNCLGLLDTPPRIRQNLEPSARSRKAGFHRNHVS
jgi:hypothetical protein